MTTQRTEADEILAAPTEDALPYSDDVPLDSERQAVQINLLARPVKLYFQDRPDVYVGANMFVCFSPTQQTTHDFRGPDVFVVTSVTKRERKSWVVWQEGKGPDVVIELLSESTRRTDMTLKRDIYATRLRVPEYFWYDPFSGERMGWELVHGEYVPVAADAHDRLPSRILGLTLVRWHGIAEGIEAIWLRWARWDGTLLPTPEEAEQRRAEAERPRAERLEQTVADQRERIAGLEAWLAELERRIREGRGPV